MSARSSRPAPPATAVAEGGQYVTLGVDGDRYAAPVSRVREILDLRPIARLPRAPAELLGVIDVRGRSIPVVDLRCLLGLPPGVDDGQTRLEQPRRAVFCGEGMGTGVQRLHRRELGGDGGVADTGISQQARGPCSHDGIVPLCDVCHHLGRC